MKMNTSSPHDKLPILEEGWRCEKDNNVSILKRIEKPSSCSRFVEIAKLIFYLELIFFIGWIGCVFLSQNIGNINYNDSKTEASRGCGPSGIDCRSSDINNQINHERTVLGVRGKRSSDEDEIKRQSCLRNMNATRDKIIQLTKQYIPGEDSDSNIILLRNNCRNEILSLTVRVMLDKLVSKTFSDPTEEQWSTFALDIQQKTINVTGEAQREKVESIGSPSTEIVTNLRTAIESMIRNYRECEKVVPTGDILSPGPSIGDVLNEREKCERIMDSLKEDARPLIVQVIPGDSSDPVIVELRRKVENITMLMAVGLTVDRKPTWNIDTISEQVGNLTDQKWQKFIDSVRDDVANSSSSDQREMIETPVTQEMISDIRTAVYKHLNKVKHCDQVTIGINKIRENVEDLASRSKRDTDSISEHGLLSDYLKNVESTMANLFTSENINLSWG